VNQRITRRMGGIYMDGLYLLLLGAATFLLVGIALERIGAVSTPDFRVVYYSARCLLDGHDPYNEKDLRDTYRRDGGQDPQDTPTLQKIEDQYIYFPSAFPITICFAILPFGVAHILWLAFTAGSLILAALLTWEVTLSYSSSLSGFLIGILLANCVLYIVLGNPGGVAIGLCVVATWCFVRERYVFAGIACMSASLMLKPHDAGLIWLFFLLAGGLKRKRALQTLLVVFLMCLAAVLWVSYRSPQWPNELRENLAANAVHGGLSDPGPHSSGGHGIGMMVNLQTVISVFRDDPRVYNPVAYLLIGVPIAIWVFRTMRLQPSSATAWFALASIAPLSMLPMYHRLYDARILLLSVPACSVLWKHGGRRAWIASILTGAAILLTGEFPWIVILELLKKFIIPDSGNKILALIVLQVFPVPILLLVTGLFYLQVYLKEEELGERDIINQ
jgi:hypothetical protein